jgi:transposase
MRNEVSKLDYTGQDIFCGLDVHKKLWSLTSSTSHRIYETVTIGSPLVENTLKYLNKKFPGGTYHAAYEAGFSGFWAQRSLTEGGVSTIVVNPADIPTTHKQRDQKTDKRDSRKISSSLRSGELSGIHVASVQAEMDRHLIRQRMSISGSERRVKHQIKSHLMFSGIPIPERMDKRHWSRRFISWLKVIQESRNDVTLRMMLDRLDLMRGLRLRALSELRKLREEQRHKELYSLLVSVPGVGMLTAMILIGEIIDIKRFSGIDQLCSFVGLIPTSKSSGERVRTGEMTHRKNNRILTHLVQASWMAIRQDQELQQKYEVYTQRMSGHKAIIKISRILLRRIRWVWIHKEKYQKAES